jgi:hypothetical protein
VREKLAQPPPRREEWSHSPKLRLREVSSTGLYDICVLIKPCRLQFADLAYQTFPALRGVTPLTLRPTQKKTARTHEQRCESSRKRSARHSKKTKTYNSGYSLVVTHLTTNPPVRCLNRAERTGSLVFNVLWSYVKEM